MRTIFGVLLLVFVAAGTGCDEPAMAFAGEDSLATDAQFDHSADVAYAMEFSDQEGAPVAAARRLGIDYADAVRRAGERDRDALATLFELTPHLQMSAAEGHRDTLWRLLYQLGDDHYASVLRSEPRSVRDAVLRELDIAGGFGSYQPSFPQTWALGKHW